MSDILTEIATKIAKAGAPTLGALIGTAVGGPAGAALGGLAGKALEAVADALGAEATPQAVNEALDARGPLAEQDLKAADANAPTMIAVWQAEVERAAKNDSIEAEKGFGAWHLRRTVTTYAVLAMLCSSFMAALAGALGWVKADTSILMVLVGHGVTIFMAWNGLVSGGRAVTDAVKAYRSSK
jgi:hypothetical protein